LDKHYSGAARAWFSRCLVFKRARASVASHKEIPGAWWFSG